MEAAGEGDLQPRNKVYQNERGHFSGCSRPSRYMRLMRAVAIQGGRGCTETVYSSPGLTILHSSSATLCASMRAIVSLDIMVKRRDQAGLRGSDN